MNVRSRGAPQPLGSGFTVGAAQPLQAYLAAATQAGAVTVADLLAAIAEALQLPATATIEQILTAIRTLQADQQGGPVEPESEAERMESMSKQQWPPGDDSDTFSLWRSLTDAQRREFGDFGHFADAFHGHRATSRPSSSRSTARRTIDLSVLKAEWRANLPNERGIKLQDEFGGDEAAFAAFKRHEAAGDITIHTRRSTDSVTVLSSERDDPDVAKFYELQRRGLATIVAPSPGRSV